MSAEHRGAIELSAEGWQLRLLNAPPLIAPARSFTFPVAVPGEEEALARGAAYVDCRSSHGGSLLAQFAIGYSGSDVAHGLWPLPGTRICLVVAGGYAYVFLPSTPVATKLLELRPVMGVLSAAGRLVLAGYHHLLVVEPDGEAWRTPRLSWEGLSIAGIQGTIVTGRGWEMPTDTELPFTLDLHTRRALGGGYRLTEGPC